VFIKEVVAAGRCLPFGTAAIKRGKEAVKIYENVLRKSSPQNKQI